MIFLCITVGLCFVIFLFRHKLTNWWDNVRGLKRTLFWRSDSVCILGYISLLIYVINLNHWDITAPGPIWAEVLLILLNSQMFALVVVAHHRSVRVKQIQKRIDFRNMLIQKRTASLPGSLPSVPTTEQKIEALLKTNRDS